MGKVDRDWQERDYILNMFGDVLEKPAVATSNTLKMELQRGNDKILSAEVWSAVKVVGLPGKNFTGEQYIKKAMNVFWVTVILSRMFCVYRKSILNENIT